MDGLLTGIVIVDCLLDLLFIADIFSAGVVLFIQPGVSLVDFLVLQGRCNWRDNRVLTSTRASRSSIAGIGS
jgi:hypothetical protein